MTKINKEEAMGYRDKHVRQIMLLAGVGVLACSLAGALCGCGSDETQPVSLQGKKPAATATVKAPQVKEILQGSAATSMPQAQLPGRIDPGTILAFPPDASGNPGMTLAEARTAANEPVNPESVMFPPDASGNPGLTLTEAKTAANKPVNPETVMFPPDKHGNPSITQGEAKNAAEESLDPQSILLPADRAGTATITMAEAKAAAEKPFDPGIILKRLLGESR